VLAAAPEQAGGLHSEVAHLQAQKAQPKKHSRQVW
jgi:hypothetical protein